MSTPSQRLTLAAAHYQRHRNIQTVEHACMAIGLASGIQWRRVARLRTGEVRMLVADADQLAAVLGVHASWIAFGENAPGWAR